MFVDGAAKVWNLEEGTEVPSLIDFLRPEPVGDHRPLPDLAERNRHHGEQAALAEKEKQWFAAFQLSRLLLDSPHDADSKRRRDAALKGHAAKAVQMTPLRMEKLP